MIDAMGAPTSSRRLNSTTMRALGPLLTHCRAFALRHVASLLVIFVCTTSITSIADTIDERIGGRVENFSLPDYHGQPHALDDHADQVVVLAFLGTECPLAKLYALRLVELATEFSSQRVAFIGIDSNLQDSLSDLGVFARAYRVPFPLLKDNNNELADRLGATRTPEVFLLDRDRVVRYRGRIDDQYGFTTRTGYAKAQLAERSLADALTEVLQGKPVTHPVREAQGCLIGRVAKVAPRGDVTYAKQIARIMQQRCVECHRSGELAPFGLTTYDEVVGWAAMILEVVEERRMPPWFANPQYGHFSNDRSLTGQERQQLVTWVENGCPRGDDHDLPEPAQFSTGWQMGEPDQIIYMSEKPFEVSAGGTVEYQFFTVDPGWETEKWIVATEARPGNRAVVHHNVVWVKAGPATDIEPTEAIAWYGPGFSPFYCAPGTAVYVPAHAKLRFSMHYTANGTAQSDRSMVGIRFADPSTVNKLVRIPYMTDRNFKIPPGDPNYEVNAERTVWQDLLVSGLLPHMHVRGKSFRCTAEYAGGRRETLLDVPRYDPNWQLRYIFAEPKLLPAGTKLHFQAHYDNSPENPANPDPTRTVTVGQQTWDEMFECQYMSVDAGLDHACRALVAASLSRDLDDAQSSASIELLRQLFALGAERSPEAVAAAAAKYLELKNLQPRATRIDVAYAIVLNNQRQFDRARIVTSACLQVAPRNISAQKARIWAELSLEKWDDAVAHLQVFADQLRRTRQVAVDEEFSAAAHFLGATLACISRLPPEILDERQPATLRADILTRLGPAYAASFAEGERAVSDGAIDARVATIVECLATLSLDRSIGYEAESRRLLSPFAKQPVQQP